MREGRKVTIVTGYQGSPQNTHERGENHCWGHRSDQHHQHGANWGRAPHGRMQRTQRCFCNIPAKEALFLPDSNPGETSSQTQTEGHSTQVWTVVFKSVKDIKIKEEMRSCSKLKEPEETGQRTHRWFWTGSLCWENAVFRLLVKTWMELEG